MKILLVGAEMINKGAEAMLRTTKTEIASRIPRAEFAVDGFAVISGSEKWLHDAGCEILSTTVAGSFAVRLRKLAAQFVKEPSRVRKIWRDRGIEVPQRLMAEQVDAVLDISGLVYSDAFWGNGVVEYRLALIHHCHVLGIPYVLLPQSFGPFHSSDELASVCRQGLSKATFAIARDVQSRANLAELLHRETASVPQSPDVAFRFQSAGSDVGREMLRGLGLGISGRDVVAISPNMRVYERSTGFGADNKYLQVLAGIGLDFLNKGVDVLFLPHEIKPGLSEADDRMLCEYLRLSLHGTESRVNAITYWETAPRIKSVISQCSMLVGSRFHALVAALDCGLPAVAIGWSHKYEELLGDFGMADHAVDFSSGDREQVVALVQQIWEQRHTDRQRIDSRLPEVRQSVDRMFDSVAKVLT